MNTSKNIVSQNPTTEMLRAVPSVVSLTLVQIGWEIRAVDLDLASGRAVMDVFRADGRWIQLSTDRTGRATIERWQRDVSFERCPGGSFSNVVTDRFLGRVRCMGARAALRVLADYIAQNPAPNMTELPQTNVRDAVRFLINDVDGAGAIAVETR